MRKRMAVICLFLVLGLAAWAQAGDFERLMGEGVALFDDGKFHEAIAKYDAALKLKPGEPVAVYEKAYALFALQEYDAASGVLAPLAAQGASAPLNVVILNGSILDMQERYDESVAAYIDGIKRYPDSYLLKFNLGLTHLKNGRSAEAEPMFIGALEKNPNHFISLVGLFHSEADLENRGKAFLAGMFALFKGDDQMRQSVRERLISLYQSSAAEGNIQFRPDPDEFISAFNLMISVVYADLLNRKVTDKTALFQEMTAALAKICSELGADDAALKGSFWGNHFGRLVGRIAQGGQLDRFVAILTDDKPLSSFTAERQAALQEIAGIIDAYYKELVPNAASR